MAWSTPFRIDPDLAYHGPLIGANPAISALQNPCPFFFFTSATTRHLGLHWTAACTAGSERAPTLPKESFRSLKGILKTLISLFSEMLRMLLV